MQKICSQHNDMDYSCLYTAKMAKKSRPIIPVTWYLREWMDTLGVRQKDMMELADWSKTTASLLYNCRQDMNADLLKAAANALNRQPYELLIEPAEAFRIIRHRQEVEQEALRLVKEKNIDFKPISPEHNEPIDKGKKKNGRKFG